VRYPACLKAARCNSLGITPRNYFLGATGLTGKAKSFGSLLDPASGCSAPQGQNHQVNCVSSGPALEEAKLNSNEHKQLFHFWVGLRKNLCHSSPCQMLPVKSESHGGPA